MLQPMQPTGQQQKPGMNMPQGAPQGAPQRAPGQQTMPAGAAMQQGILPGGIASNPEDIKAAYGGTPQGQQKLKQAAGQGDYLSAIALSQILEEERERAAAKATPQEGGEKPQPVVDRMRDEAVDLRRQDLEEQQAKRLGMEQQRSQGAMAQMAQQAARPPMQGISQLPAPNVAQPQAMAAGGIVAFAKGGDMPVEVEEKTTEEIVRPVGANPYAGLNNRQIVEKYGREQLGTNRQEEERRAREEYLKFAGYSPEEKARQEKRIADMEAYDKEAYGPDRVSSDRLFYALANARGANPSETLSNYGISSINYGNKMRELVRQRMSDRQKQAETWDEAQRGARVKGYEAGTGQGKEVLAGQRQGIAGLGDVIQAETSASNAALRASGSGGDAYAKASKLIAIDPTIRNLNKRLEYMVKNGEQDTPEYRQIQQDIADREAQYYEKYKVEGILPPPIKEPEVKPKDEGNWLTNLFSGDKQKERGQQLNQQLGLGSTPQSQGNLPQGIPPGSVKIGASNGNPVYETPDGKRLVVKP